MAEVAAVIFLLALERLAVMSVGCEVLRRAILRPVLTSLWTSLVWQL